MNLTLKIPLRPGRSRHPASRDTSPSLHVVFEPSRDKKHGGRPSVFLEKTTALLLLLILSLAGNAYAEPGGFGGPGMGGPGMGRPGMGGGGPGMGGPGMGQKGNFEERKKEMLSNIEERLSALQAEKSCVSAAQSHEAMKVCREQMRQKQSEFQAKRIDDQIKRLQEEKARLSERPAANEPPQ